MTSVSFAHRYDPLFFGVDSKGTLFEYTKMADLLAIPYLENFYIMRELHHEAPNNYGNGNLQYYHYKIIDRDEKRSTISVRDFEIVEIEPEVNYYGRFDYRNIRIYDKVEQRYHTYVSRFTGEKFIIEDLLFLINKLRAISNWDILLEYLQISVLKKKIEKLTEENFQLKKLLQDKNGDQSSK